jgi:hypothetical protein
MEVSHTHLLQIIGEQTVQLRMQRARVESLEAEVARLTPKPEPSGAPEQPEA